MSTAVKIEVPGPRVVVGRLQRTRSEGRPAVKAPKAIGGSEPARVALMLALAHTIQRAIDKGEIRDQAEAARRLGTTRARATQLLDLALLSPALQEQVFRDEGSWSERSLRRVAAVASWTDQIEALPSGD